MPTSIHTYWKILINLDEDAPASIQKLFNVDTGKGFVRSLGGRASMVFGPKTLTCTTSFYDLLGSATRQLGFEGRKFPLNHIAEDCKVNFRFRLYQRILVMEVERSPVAIRPETDLIELTSLWSQKSIAGLVLSIIGLIANPTSRYAVAAQRPKAFTCNRLIYNNDAPPDTECLVKLLTRHKTVTHMVIANVVDKNKNLQSDSSTLLIDRQGVVAAVPALLASDKTTMRRFPAAINMLEIVSVVERMLERQQLELMPRQEFEELASWFRDPQERFTFSTSSLHIWKRVAAEFGMDSARWLELERKTMTKNAHRQNASTILIVTALEAEAGPSLKRLSDVSPENRSGVYLNRGTVITPNGPATVFVCSVGIGNAKAIMNTSRLMEVLHPNLTIFCGIAGGRKEAVIGSVVVASLVYNYESGKDRPEGFAPRPRHVNLSQSAEFLASAFLAKERGADRNYESFLKPIACGEKVLGTTKGASAAVIDSTYGDALAVEMEGFGFLSALENSKTPAILVRGISDRLDKKEEEENHELAIDNATDLVFRLIDYFVAASSVR